MNRSKTCAALFAALLCAAAPAAAGPMTTQAKPNYEATYTLVADGSAVMETLEPGTESPMITLYHPDGNRVMMTHYCSAHNQPRMRAEAPAADPGSLTFSFVDATNLASPAEGHMDRLVVSFVDTDHFAQEWTFKVKGQKQVDVFNFQRAN